MGKTDTATKGCCSLLYPEAKNRSCFLIVHQHISSESKVRWYSSIGVAASEGFQAVHLCGRSEPLIILGCPRRPPRLPPHAAPSGPDIIDLHIKYIPFFLLIFNSSWYLVLFSILHIHHRRTYLLMEVQQRRERWIQMKGSLYMDVISWYVCYMFLCWDVYKNFCIYYLLSFLMTLGYEVIYSEWGANRFQRSF